MNVPTKSLATFVLCVGIATGSGAAVSHRSKSERGSADVRSRAVRSWMRALTLNERVAQLVMVPFYGDAPNTRSEEYQKYLRWVRHLRVGGMILVNRVQDGRVRSTEPYAMATFANRMQRVSKLPLLFAGDFERGDSMRVISKTLFPHAMAFAATRDPELSRYEGAVTARQGVALGVPWIFAPVSDVNNNPDNPIINIRAYSENPAEVSAHVRAFIEGAHSVKSVLVTVKHFPGHGDTSTDTHLALAVNPAARERLDTVEFVPFRAAIAAGVDSIMTAHIAVPAIDQPNVPSTLSNAVLTGVLRKEFEFRGIITTDALDMAGVAKQWPPAQAAVRAIQAGADVLLMPANPEEAVAAVVHAVRRGEISRERIDESVRKVLSAKVKLGLDRRRFVNLETMMDELDPPEDIAKAQEVADRAVTLVRNDRDFVPLRNPLRTCFTILTESRGSQQGRLFAAEVRRRAADAAIVTLDPTASQADLDQAAKTIESCDTAVIAAFVSVAANKGNVALAGGYPGLVDRIVASGKPAMLISLGNPYLLRSFPGVAAYMATYSTVQPSETAAVKALFGEISIGGRLPVTIPGVAKYGDGIHLAAVAISK